MRSPEAEELATEVAAAHAAPTLGAAARVDVTFSSGGLAFAAKGQPAALSRAEARLGTVRQEAEVVGQVPRPWRLTARDSSELRSHLDRLRRGARWWRWDPEDVGAFAAAALWTYLMMPVLLARAEQLERLPDAAGLRRLRLTLPPTMAGHSSTQTLHVGSGGLIERHDYTATAFGTWARAAQVVGSYDTFDGVPVGTCRRVTPRLQGRRLPVPELVWIEIHEVRLG